MNSIVRARPVYQSPRRSVDYDNEIDGRPDKQDCDSRSIIERNRKLLVPPATDRWHDSHAAARLDQFPKSGVWVPAWVARVSRHPARALLLSWLLNLFDTGLKIDQNGLQHVRAGARDEDGVLWWRTTRERLTAETLLRPDQADRARKTLARMGLIEAYSTQTGLHLRPCGYKLITAFHRITGSDDALDELKTYGEKVEWCGTMTHKIAMKAENLGSHGTRIHDALLVICDYRPGPALVLAHVLFWHGLNPDECSRARIDRGGHLWIARSQRQMQTNPGGDPQSLAAHVRWLEDKGFLATSQWVYSQDRDYSRPTLHIRPRPSLINESLNARQVEICRAIERKHSWRTSQPISFKE